MSEFDWLETRRAYYGALKSYRPEVLREAINRSMGQHPDFMPTVPQLQQEALVVYQEHQRLAYEQQKKRALPPPPNRELARQALYSACDAAMKTLDGSKQIDDGNRNALEGLVTLLGAVYGIPQHRMEGDQRPSSAVEERFNHSRAYVTCAQVQGISPSRFAWSIRQCPVVCTQCPSVGVILEIARTGASGAETHPGAVGYGQPTTQEG